MNKVLYVILFFLLISCGDDDNSSQADNSQYQYSLCGVVNRQSGFNNSFSAVGLTSNGITYTISAQNAQTSNTLNQLSNGQSSCVYSNTLSAQTTGQYVFYAESIALGTTGTVNNNGAYQYNFCGTLYYRNGNSGGANSYVLATSSGTYTVYPDSAQASSVLNNQNLQSNACVYTNKNIQQGYQGSVIYAQQITF